LAHQSHSFYVTMRRRSRSTLFPYTTLFRSVRPAAGTPSRQGGRGATAPPAAPRRGAVAGWKEYSGLGGEAARSTPSPCALIPEGDRKSTRLNSSHVKTSYAVFCLKKKTLIT